jgi:hypothetical protein
MRSREWLEGRLSDVRLRWLEGRLRGGGVFALSQEGRGLYSTFAPLPWANQWDFGLAVAGWSLAADEAAHRRVQRRGAEGAQRPKAGA